MTKRGASNTIPNQSVKVPKGGLKNLGLRSEKCKVNAPFYFGVLNIYQINILLMVPNLKTSSRLQRLFADYREKFYKCLNGEESVSDDKAEDFSYWP